MGFYAYDIPMALQISLIVYCLLSYILRSVLTWAGFSFGLRPPIPSP
jgi:hypothetical protein